MSERLKRLTLFGGMLFLFGLGVLAAHSAFHDPDSCWLLALGRWIVEHRGFPVVDPFSSGVATSLTVGKGLPLLQYQWLAEVLFYQMYLLAGLTGVRVLVAVIACAAFFFMPYRLLQKAQAPYVVTLLTVFISSAFAALRFLARPEIFSFLYLAVLLNALLFVEDFSLSRQWRRLAAIFVIMALWCNTHILFPLGIAVIGLVGLASIVESMVAGRGASKPALFAACSVILGCLATLLNPWGIGVWIYFLRALGTKSMNLVVENAPLSPLSPIGIILLLGFLGILWLSARSLKKYRLLGLPFITLVLTFAGVIIAFSHQRFVPFAPIFLSAGLAQFFYMQARMRRGEEMTSPLSSLPMNFRLAASSFLCVALGAITSSSLLPTTLPETCDVFVPPIAAVEFLKQHPMRGRLLNDPQFGSVMIWYLPISAMPDLFLDTRLAFFQDERVLDYEKMANLEGNWQALLSKYQFEWAFLRADRPLAAALKQLGWEEVYRDSVAVIYRNPRS